jgi:hypothetical protein
MPLYEQIGDLRSKSVTLGQISDILYMRGETEEALRIRQEDQLPLCKKLGDVRELSVVLQKIGVYALELSQFSPEGIRNSRNSLEESYSIAVQQRMLDGIVGVGQILAQVLALDGDKEKAYKVLDQVEAAYIKLGDQRGLDFIAQIRADIEGANERSGIAPEPESRP